jgi:hypothetical protein
MRAQKSFERLDRPACAFMCLDCDSNPFSSGQLVIMVEGIGTVDEILEMAADVVVIRGRTDDEHIAIEYFADYFFPVIVLDNTPFLLLAFLAAKTRVDLFACKRDKFGFDSLTLTAFENDIDQICGVAFPAHAPRYSQDLHTIPSTQGFMIVLVSSLQHQTMTGHWSQKQEQLKC